MNKTRMYTATIVLDENSYLLEESLKVVPVNKNDSRLSSSFQYELRHLNQVEILPLDLSYQSPKTIGRTLAVFFTSDDYHADLKAMRLFGMTEE